MDKYNCALSKSYIQQQFCVLLQTVKVLYQSSTARLVVAVAIIVAVIPRDHDCSHYHSNDSKEAKNVDKDVPDERGPAQVSCTFIVSIGVGILGLQCVCA